MATAIDYCLLDLAHFVQFEEKGLCQPVFRLIPFPET